MTRVPPLRGYKFRPRSILLWSVSLITLIKTDISLSIKVYFHTPYTFVILNNSELELSFDLVNRLTTMIVYYCFVAKTVKVVCTFGLVVHCTMHSQKPYTYGIFSKYIVSEGERKTVNH